MIVRAFVAACVSILATASVSLSLSKESRLFEDRADDWNAGTSCVASYYNVCTGWIWVWENFGHGDRFGVVSGGCCGSPGPSSLLQSAVYVATAAPAGRGFTGTISVYSVDASNCLAGPAIASQPFLPTSVFHLTSWGGVPVSSPFALVVTYAEAQGIPNPGSFGSDHPAAGPSGPQACGVCFPADRSTRSFRFGTATAPLCPGEPFDDGVCNAELIWDFSFACPTPVDESSWGKLKTLYK